MKHIFLLLLFGPLLISCNQTITQIDYYHQGHVYDNSLIKETKVISADELKSLAQTLGIQIPIDPNARYIWICHGQQSYKRDINPIKRIELRGNTIISIETEPIRSKDYPIASPVMNTPYQIIKVPK